MVELSGALTNVDLLPMLHFLAGLRQSGSVYLSGNGWSARLGIRSGRVVAASFAEERGLAALAPLGLLMNQADFVYSEGPGPPEREFDLTPEALHKYLNPLPGPGTLSLDAVPQHASVHLDEVPDGEHVLLKKSTVRTLLAVDGRRTIRDIINEGQRVAILTDLARLLDIGLVTLDSAERGYSRPGVPAPAKSLVTMPLRATSCPKLGFADDPAIHFRRPTPLHRCFASGSGKSVTTLEQRELCLRGEYGTCQRLRDAVASGFQVEAFLQAHVLTATRTLRDAIPASNAWAAVGGPVLPLHSPVIPLEERVASDLTATDADARQWHEGRLANDPGSEAPGAPAIPKALAEQTNSNWLFRSLKPVSIALSVVASISILLAIVLLHFETELTTEAPVSTMEVVPTTRAAAVPGGETARLPAASTPGTAPGTSASRPTTPAPQTTSIPGLAATPATALAAVSASPAAAPPRVAAPVIMETWFSSPQSGWRENAPFTFWAAGAFRLSPRVSGRFVALGAPLAAPLADVHVTASFRKVSGPTGGGYGIIVRDKEPGQRDGLNQRGNYYVLQVGDRGEVGVWRREDDHWADILGWTHSEAVVPGAAANELTVEAVGKRLTLSVNGFEVTTQTDDVVSPGGVGVFVGGDQNEVALDYFRVETRQSGVQ